MADEFRAQPGEATYATLAHVINAVCAPDPPVVRQQVYNWAHRPNTVNNAGEPFPAPVRELPEAEGHKGQPGRFYSTAQVLDWYKAGVGEQTGSCDRLQYQRGPQGADRKGDRQCHQSGAR